MTNPNPLLLIADLAICRIDPIYGVENRSPIRGIERGTE